MSNPTNSESHTLNPALIPTSPFDSPEADVILRSSDGADFHVYKAILALVSPVFHTMFSLPQPASEAAVPVIPVHEDSALLDRALRYFYPGTQPTATTLDELRVVLDVLVSKYDIECIVPTAKQHLERYLVDQPLAVYAVAVTHQWKDLATTAAKETLKLPLRVPANEVPPGLKDIPAATYHNLLRYHYLCGLAAKGITNALRWIPAPNDYVWFSCTTCTQAELAWFLSDGVAHTVRIWFINYLKTLGAVLAETPGIEIVHHESIYAALTTAAQCSVCRAKTSEQLPAWVTTQLKSKIVEAVNEVELKF
ncbi:hypothetical protein DFH09DRAFT_1167076 [Mycena vulgaris]|nr:hypothetical protein DFH09DRAFT_1167076 [Mycena vulgaris]